MEFLDWEQSTHQPWDKLIQAPLPSTDQRCLRFPLGEDSALVPLEQVTEIINVNSVDLLPVPAMPRWVLGICNWRGEMLWLIDFNQVVGYSSVLQDEPTPTALTAIVIQINYQFIGIAVPQVNDIEQHNLQQLQPVIAGLFPSSLLPLVLGILSDCCDPVVNLKAVTLSPIWKNCQGASAGSSS